MPPRKRKKTAPADQVPAAQPPPGVHIQASATVGHAEGSQVTGAVVNAPDAQSIQIGDRVAGDKVLGDHVFGDKIVYPSPSPPATPALHQLRAPVGDFVGREAEIAQLTKVVRRAIGSGTVAAITGVRGMGGIGKTELAYVVAQQLEPDFPDAQIVVELRGASDPLTPVQALQTVIRAFEREARLGDDLAELQAIYRSLLSGRHVLVLADDARDSTQVRPLLPPSGSALLVTSRYRFTLPGMHTIDLGMLAPAEAEALLLTICPRMGEAAPALAKLCGYLPLALRVSASLLASDATLPMARYLEQLANERTRLAALRDRDDPALNVDASLALSYAALAPVVQGTLCQLSVFVSDFDLSAAQAVVIVEDGQIVDGVLGDLYRRSLLDYDTTLERYSLHDLVRVFARDRLDVDATEALRLRYAQHYAGIARQGNDLYLQGGDSVLAGLALFDRERAHIDAGWAWARGQEAGPAIDEVLLAYADATVYIGALRYDLRREQVLLFEVALAAAQRHGHRADQGRLLGNLGITYAQLGEVRRAINSCNQALVIMREEGDRHGEGAMLCNLGNAYTMLGEMRRAIACYEQSLVIMREVGNRHEEGQTLGNLGSAYADLGEVQRAIELYEQRLVIACELGDRRGEGRVLGNLGSAYADLDNAEQAIEFYEQRLEIAREVGDRRGGALGSWNLGEVLAERGEIARAITLMQVRVDFERSIGHTDAEAHATQVTALRQQLQAAAGSGSPEGDTPTEDLPA